MCDLSKGVGGGGTESASFGIFCLFSALPLPPIAFCFLMTPSTALIPSILSTHTHTHTAASHCQTVAARGQVPAGGCCIDPFPTVGVAENAHTLKRTKEQHLLHLQLMVADVLLGGSDVTVLICYDFSIAPVMVQSSSLHSCKFIRSYRFERFKAEQGINLWTPTTSQLRGSFLMYLCCSAECMS